MSTQYMALQACTLSTLQGESLYLVHHKSQIKCDPFGIQVKLN